jgi:hypothetical protein
LSTKKEGKWEEEEEEEEEELTSDITMRKSTLVLVIDA